MSEIIVTETWVDEGPPGVAEDGTGWWVFLVTGIAWLIVSLFVLQFDTQAAATIAIIFGVVILLAAAEEIYATFALSSGGWRLLHLGLAILFLFGGIFAFAYPGQTFGTLAILVAWFLLIRGTVEAVVSLFFRHVELWWLRLISGILQIIIAVWAIGYPGRSAYLLILWVGLSALARGIAQIILAFQVRSYGKRVAA